MRLLLRHSALLLLLALVPALAAAFFHPRRPSWDPEEISLGALPADAAKILWIDARPLQEFEEAHIPGAFSLNEDDWEAGLAPVLDAWQPGQTVVVYCSSLSCRTSHEVAGRLTKQVGLKEVRVLKGGWEAWLKSAR